MSSTLAKFGGRDGRPLWVIVAGAQLWLACSGADSPKTSRPAPSVGAAAGGYSDGGGGDCKVSPGGAPDDCTADLWAGATGIGGTAGADGAEQAGGAGGAEEVPDGGIDGEGGASSGGFIPASHPPFPLVSAHGGPVLKNIELVPVYFGADPLRVDLEKFNSWIVSSDYWEQAGAEYGVHAGTRLPALQFDSVAAASISDTQIASWLDARVADGSLPKPTANTLFALFYQAGTTVTTATGTSCRAFAALHESVPLANPIFTGDVSFAIIPRCSFSPGDELEIATDVASHEYMEAATCPLPLSNPSWLMDNDRGPLEAWSILSGPAVADLCLNQSYDVVDGFSVNDIWSNAAAQAGRNPCQPSDPKHPFFAVSSDATIYHAQPGATLTIHARAWSNMPAPDWSLGVNWGLVPYSDFDGQAILNATTVNNGDEVTATVTIPSNPPVADGRSVYRFTIDSVDPINPNFSHPWPVLVVVP